MKSGAVGLVAKTGRYGGTYAHKNLAFEFCVLRENGDE